MPAVMLFDNAYDLIAKSRRFTYLLNNVGGMLSVNCVDSERELATVGV